MINVAEATQVFEKAIKLVGLENFKKTSIFMSSALERQRTDSLAA